MARKMLVNKPVKNLLTKQVLRIVSVTLVMVRFTMCQARLVGPCLLLAGKVSMALEN